MDDLNQSYQTLYDIQELSMQGEVTENMQLHFFHFKRWSPE